MKKIMFLLAALAIAAPAGTPAESASFPLRDARQVTAAQTAAVTNTFAVNAATLDRVAVRADAPVSGTFTLRHVWSADGITTTNSYAVAYTNTATAETEITNAWPLLSGDLLIGDFGSVATGKFWVGRSKLNYSPAR